MTFLVPITFFVFATALFLTTGAGNCMAQSPGSIVAWRGAERSISDLSGDADLDEMVEFALQRNPAIAQAKARVKRMLAMVPQARALPDPKIRFSAGSMAETAAGRVDWMTAVEQALPYPGKLRKMAAAASKEAEAAAMELDSLRIAIAAQVRMAYWDYYLATKATEITGANRAALGQVRDSVDARVSTNQATQNDQLRLAVEFGKIEKSLIEYRQASASAEAQLNALLNRPSQAGLPAPKWMPNSEHGDLKALLAQAEATHPDVRAATAKLDAFQSRLDKANLDRFPDFNLAIQHAAIADDGLAPMANGRDQAFATLGLSIPLWQEPRRARVREASAGIDEAYASRDASRATLRFRVEDAWLKAKSAAELIDLFEKQVLPESSQAFDSSLTAYAAGKLTFVDVLDTWRQHLGFQLQQASHQTQLGKAAAALQSATGELH